MTRKLLILGALLGFSVLGLQKPAGAIPTCSNANCFGQTYDCICPASTPAAGSVMGCRSWRADCTYA